MTALLDPAIAEAIDRGLNTSQRLIAESRLVGSFDAVFETGGVQPCLRIITILTERLAERMRRDAAVAMVADQDSGWVA